MKYEWQFIESQRKHAVSRMKMPAIRDSETSLFKLIKQRYNTYYIQTNKHTQVICSVRNVSDFAVELVSASAAPWPLWPTKWYANSNIQPTLYHRTGPYKTSKQTASSLSKGIQPKSIFTRTLVITELELAIFGIIDETRIHWLKMS